MKRGCTVPGLALLFAAVLAAPAAHAGAERSRRSWWPAMRLAKVGILEIDGAIYDPREVNAAIRKLDANPLVKAMVLRVDSPGGEVGAVQEITAELKRFRANGKPIVASFGGVAASGGYYLASVADRIISNPGALTGSIGVIMEFPDAEDLLKKIGVRYVVVKSGRYKDTGSFARGLSAEERAVLKTTIDDVYQQFVDSIWEGRRPQIRLAYAKLHHLTPAKVSDRDAKAFLLEAADGRVMSGRQALAAGLVDELGGQDDAIAAAGRLAGIGDHPGRVIPQRRRESSWTDLLGTLFGGPPPEALWPRRARVSLGYLLR